MSRHPQQRKQQQRKEHNRQKTRSRCERREEQEFIEYNDEFVQLADVYYINQYRK